MLYADDLALIVENVKQAQWVINFMEEWSRNNEMTINKEKCGAVKLCKRTTKIKRKDIKGIPVVQDYKFLGV